MLFHLNIVPCSHSLRFVISMILEDHIDLLNMGKETLEWHCGPHTKKFCVGLGNLE